MNITINVAVLDRWAHGKRTIADNHVMFAVVKIDSIPRRLTKAQKLPIRPFTVKRNKQYKELNHGSVAPKHSIGQKRLQA